MPQEPGKPKEFRFFLRSWYNTTRAIRERRIRICASRIWSWALYRGLNHCRARDKTGKKSCSIPYPSAAPGEPEGAKTHGIRRSL